MAKELDKVIVIGDESYNVNANKATQVENALTLNKVTLTGAVSKAAGDAVVFDGHEAKSIDLVTADGGRFNDKIRVPRNSDTTIHNEAVLNYGDIKEKFIGHLLNNSVLYKWNKITSDSPEDPKFKLDPTTTVSNLAGMSLVYGTEEDRQAFAAKNYNDYCSNKNSYLAAFLYICSDSGNIYFGTYNTGEITKLATTANKLDFATSTPMSLSVNLAASKDSNSIASLKDAANIELGIKGTLPKAHGGLGGDISNSDKKTAKATEFYLNNSLEEVSTGTGTAQINDNTQIIFKRDDVTSTEKGFCVRRKASQLWTYIASKIREIFGFSTENVLSTNNGGTGATSLDNITVGKATADASGLSLRKNYYKISTGSIIPTESNNQNGPWITISSDDPTKLYNGQHGNNGDIWIVHN
jgi:hypothetical protein